MTNTPKQNQRLLLFLKFIFCVLFVGLLFAFDDYVNYFKRPSSTYSLRNIENDTGSKMERRFEIGACVGAALGAYVVFQSGRKDE
jgi:hypothetical protein